VNPAVPGRPHLLLFGWYRPGTGFTRVLEALVPHLARDYRITWMGVGYRGPVREWAPGIRLEPTNLEGGDMVGAYAARLRWRELAPDLVFALNDPWYLEHYSRELTRLLDAVPMVGYLPLDGRLDTPGELSRLTGYRCLLTYTETAAGNLRETLEAAGNPIPVECLGHGVDTVRFRPDPRINAETIFGPGPESPDRDLKRRRMELARRFFGLPDPAFVVLNAARPDPRKRIDLTLEAFARFARDRPNNVRLCLHQALGHPEQVEPLRARAVELGIEDRVIWHPPKPGPLSDHGLNRLFNACAVGINTAAGEGFGLVSFEHAATGVPQILPDQPALRELWGDAAMRPGTRSVRTPFSPLEMVEVSADETAEVLGRLHDEPDLYRRMSQAARERATAPDLEWRRIGTTLRRILRKTAGASAGKPL